MPRTRQASQKRTARSRHEPSFLLNVWLEDQAGPSGRVTCRKLLKICRFNAVKNPGASCCPTVTPCANFRTDASTFCASRYGHSDADNGYVYSIGSFADSAETLKSKGLPRKSSTRKRLETRSSVTDSPNHVCTPRLPSWSRHS